VTSDTRNPAAHGRVPEEVVIAGKRDPSGTSPESKTQARAGQLVDRYGHLHSEAVLRHWSPQALKVLGIHRVGEEPEDGEQ
jgi:hypothetical protein